MNAATSLITIGVTSFDRTELLIETIDSILNQTFQDFNIIISNDNPNRKLDPSEFEILQNPRIRIVNQMNNLGEIENLNWLLNQCNSIYFTWLADDDLMHPEFLQILVSKMLNSPSSLVVYSNYAHGSVPDSSFSTLNREVEFKRHSTGEFLEMYSWRKLHLIGCYGLFKTEIIKKVGGFRKLGSGFSPGSDTLIPILISAKTDIEYVDLPLIFLRTHPFSRSTSSPDLFSYISAEIDFMDEVAKILLSFPPLIRRRILLGFLCWFTENHLTVAKRYLDLNVISMSLTFLKTELLSMNNFRRLEVGMFIEIQHFCYTFKILNVDLIQKYLYPKLKPIIYFFSQE